MAAEELGAPFVDVDAAIEAAQGVTVRELFDGPGEAAFRELERREVEAALEAPPSVVAPGGGWAAQAGTMEYAAGRALSVFLQTDPTVAARRVASEGSRPLLDGPDPAGRMADLLAAREGRYRAAEAVVPTDGRTIQEVAARLAELARSRAGW
jgi:shikimate kinase